LDPNQLNDLGTNSEAVSEPVEDLSLASPFLSNIPAADRAVVGRYIKDWDAGVTKKFQSYADKIKQYEALGPHEELQRYVNFARNFQQDPEAIFRMMWNGLHEQYGEQFEPELARILQVELEQEMSDQGMDPQEFDQNGNGDTSGQPDPFQQNVMEELGSFRQFMEEYQANQLRQEEDKQLDTVLQAMHNKYGQFDDDYVLGRIVAHGNVDQAFKDWQAMLGRYNGGQGTPRQAPKVMGVQGGVPANNVDMSKLRGKDRRSMVANLLEAAQQE
jgi:hypothetical protein